MKPQLLKQHNNSANCWTTEAASSRSRVQIRRQIRRKGPIDRHVEASRAKYRNSGAHAAIKTNLAKAHALSGKIKLARGHAGHRQLSLLMNVSVA